jgi:hypothetical protein
LALRNGQHGRSHPCRNIRRKREDKNKKKKKNKMKGNKYKK